MGTSAARSSYITEYFTHGDKGPGLQVVNGMNVIATKRAVEFARKWAVDDRYGGHSMSGPGTASRTREEV
ncbi:hypothetical protein HYPSUDRAFT_1080565 [Hypholoma sublateritium FD-334 SS-4]|uniref:Dehydrogenase E1 component domain-containing protein n=1 Tax=Hypholoma sublateritium (strain FD-334 SS-4) TaxID=945553 RepID=A0A0D2NXK5_HYPSF|nr:hypothetical protein HYPSUDRAFT_1080565 [Hypholoma sublateritium FD-334 SS-4]